MKSVINMRKGMKYRLREQQMRKNGNAHFAMQWATWLIVNNFWKIIVSIN
jgi:hypothetical protein